MMKVIWYFGGISEDAFYNFLNNQGWLEITPDLIGKIEFISNNRQPSWIMGAFRIYVNIIWDFCNMIGDPSWGSSSIVRDFYDPCVILLL